MVIWLTAAAAGVWESQRKLSTIGDERGNERRRADASGTVGAARPGRAWAWMAAAPYPSPVSFAIRRAKRRGGAVAPRHGGPDRFAATGRGRRCPP